MISAKMLDEPERALSELIGLLEVTFFEAKSSPVVSRDADSVVEVNIAPISPKPIEKSYAQILCNLMLYLDRCSPFLDEDLNKFGFQNLHFVLVAVRN